MNPHQLILATGFLAGCSLFLHLLSARNFLPDEEVWMMGSVFWYIHYWLNFVARGSLLGAAISIAIDVQKPNFITDILSISRRQFKLYLAKMLAIATLSIFIRFITPGPVTSFSFFYKLSFVCALCGMIVTVVEDGGAGMMSLMSPIKRRLGIRKKNHPNVDQEDDQEMKLNRSGSGSFESFSKCLMHQKSTCVYANPFSNKPNAICERDIT